MACSYMYSHMTPVHLKFKVPTQYCCGDAYSSSTTGMSTQMQEADLLRSCGMTSIRKLLVIARSICHMAFILSLVSFRELEVELG